jgi:hypothetical protein
MTIEELQKLNLKLVKSRTYFRKGKKRVSFTFCNEYSCYGYRVTFRNNDEEIWPVIKRIPILEREFFD